MNSEYNICKNFEMVTDSNFDTNTYTDVFPGNRELIVFLCRLLNLQKDLEIQFYFVGGCVRDTLLNAETFDIDIAVNGNLERVQEYLDKEYSLTLSILGTAKLTIGKYHIDLAQFRSEIYLQNNGLPTVLDGDLESDIMRRDFTINTGYVHLSETSINWIVGVTHNSTIEITFAHPNFHEDIENRILRILHDKSFEEDASRLLRAVKYLTLNRLIMEPQTEYAFYKALESNAISHFSQNRYRQIILIYLEHESGLDLLMALHKHGLLLRANPKFEIETFELTKLYPFTFDSWALKVVILLLMYEEQLEFWFEADKKIALAARTCDALLKALKQIDLNTKYDVYKQFVHIEQTCIAFVLMTTQVNLDTKNTIATILKESAAIKLMLNGNDLLALGMNPGKEIGTALNLLLEYEVNSGLNLSREEEIKWIESNIYEHRDKT